MRKPIFFITLMSALLLPGTRGCAQDGGVFLKLPLSPRAGGMGDASAALADDPFGLYYNPAGMVYAKRPAVSFIYHQYLQDISGSAFGFVYPFKNFTLGVAPTVFKMKEEPIYDSLGVDTGDKFDYGSKIIPVALAGKMGLLAVGVAGKLYSENIAGQASATIAYDAGAIYKYGRLSFGAAIQNVGGKIFGYDVVKVRRAGVAYTGPQYSAAADLNKEGEDESSLGLGVAFTLAEIVKLRGGWRVKDEFGGMTFGLGLELWAVSFDYAYLSYGDLGATHKAGISLAFGANARKSEKPESSDAQKASVNSVEEPVEVPVPSTPWIFR